MAKTIWVVRLVSEAGHTLEYYYKSKKAQEKAFENVAKAYMGKDFADLTDDFGIRQVVDLSRMISVIRTDTKSGAETVAAIDEANDFTPEDMVTLK